MTQATLQASDKAKRFAHLINAKRSKQDREIAEAVEVYRRELAERENASPTHERMKKGDVKRTVVKGEGIRYRPAATIVDRYEGKWRPESELAFKRLMDDAKAADVTGITIDYHRSGLRSEGGRVGGLNTEQLRKIEAFERFQYVMDRLPRSARRLCEWLLLGEKLEATGEAPTLADCGRYLFGYITDKRSAEMIGLGAMVITGESLAAIYSQHQMEARFAEARVRNTREVGR